MSVRCALLSWWLAYLHVDAGMPDIIERGTA